MVKAAIPLSLVICGSIILQYHAIPFWREYLGTYVGTGASLFVEAVGLWAWTLNGRIAILIGLYAASLTLIPPCYQKYDVFINMGQQQAKVYADSVQLIKDEINERQEKIDVFLRNSEKRTGWADLIKDEGEELHQLRAKLNKKLSNPVIQPDAINSTVMLTLQVMLLIFALVSNIFALRKLREQFCAAQMRTDVQSQPEDNIGLPFKELQEKVTLYMEKNNLLSITEAAKKIGVDRHNLTYLIKYDVDGDRKPKKAVVQHLQRYFKGES